ncbi:hypothetical protein [Gilliamella apicola]|uniref:hypothetical protein n=1 Tax=Gilliamella apicola TaxID=1196095 RepID=UPI00080EBFF6|nr:hypothetical protein [Gilliamella apicola]OCG12654.1 hypothetical protein A9G14_04700 [Gilliamella apicola]
MQYLFNENPVVIDRELATVIGLNEAIILQQMQYWIKKSTHEIDDKTWIYNSVSQWKEQFPFWSESTIDRTIRSLDKLGLLFIGNYNRDRRDRTKWYSINYSQLDNIMKNAFSQNDECNLSNCDNAISQDDPMQDVNLTRPLPKITTEITTNNNTSSCDDKSKSEKTDVIDFDLVMDAYNDAVENRLPKVSKMTTARKNAVKKLLKELEQPTFQNLAGYFYDFVDNAKPFYFGENDRGWRADFDYIIKPSTYLKVVEGTL